MRLEIAEAGWFHYSQLPERLPSIQSMSGRLIAHFVKQVQGYLGLRLFSEFNQSIIRALIF